MRDGLGRENTLLVLGGGSDIGLATARALVSRGARTVGLAARKPDALQEQAEELRRLGARSVILAEFDADDVGTHASFVADATGGAPDSVGNFFNRRPGFWTGIQAFIHKRWGGHIVGHGRIS